MPGDTGEGVELDNSHCCEYPVPCGCKVKVTLKGRNKSMKDINVEFSPNGILGRIMGPDLIVYPGVFLGLPCDVHMPRGVPVFGPDLVPDVRAVVVAALQADQDVYEGRDNAAAVSVVLNTLGPPAGGED